MPTYTVKDEGSGKVITFEWNGDKPPDDSDLQEVFAAAQNNGRDPEWMAKNPNLAGAFGAAKALYEQVGKPLAETGGMILGGMVGAPGGIPGSLMGGTIGYAGSKKFTRGIDSLINKIEGKKQSPPKTAGEGIKEGVSDLKTGLENELSGQSIGAGVGAAIRKIAGPMAKKFATERVLDKNTGKVFDAPSISKQQLVDTAKAKGVRLTPAEITGSKTMALGESLLEKIPRATDVIREMRMKKQLDPLLEQMKKLSDKNASQESIEATGEKIRAQVTKFLQEEKNITGDSLNKLRDDVIKRIGTNKTQFSVGQKAKEYLLESAKESKGRVDDAYGKVKEAIPPGQKETPALTETAKNILSERQKLAGQDSKMMSHLKWAASDIPTNVQKELDALPDIVRKDITKKMMADYGKEWATLENFTKEMNALAKKEDALGMALPGMKYQQTPEGAIYTQLKKAAEKDLETIATNSGSKASDLLKTAKTVYGKEAEIFKSDTIRQLGKVNPEDVVGTVFRPGGVTEVQLARKALGKNGFEEAQRGLTNRLLGVGKNDTFDPSHLKTQISKYGDDMLQEVYGKKTVAELKNIAKNGLDLTTQKPGRSFLKRLADEYPEDIVDNIIGSGEGTLASKTLNRNMRIIKDVVGEKEFATLGQRLLEKIMKVSGDTGLIRPQSFAKTVDKYSDKLYNFYQPAKVDELKQLAVIGHQLNKAEKLAGNPSGTGQMIVAWGFLRMLMSLPGATTAQKLSTSLLAVVPKQMAKFYTSDVGRKYLTEGFSVPKTVDEAAALVAKIKIVMDEKGDK